MPGRFALELDGIPCGFLSAFEGGNITADVVTEQVGPDLVQRKHLGSLRVEPITIECGFDMAKPLFDWVSAMLSGQAPRKSGAIIALDFNNKETARRVFMNALISEIQFPALDAASKEPGRMTITLAPETLRFDQPSAKLAPPPVSKQKLWLPSNFRLNIQGLEPATSKVNKIEALVIKQKVAEQAPGDARDYQKQAGSLEYPNLVITLPESQAALFYKWHEDYVLKGNNGQDKEKPGVLDLLSPDFNNVLASLQFQNLGIFKVATEPVQAGDAISRVKVEMYCERITFQVKT